MQINNNRQSYTYYCIKCLTIHNIEKCYCNSKGTVIARNRKLNLIFLQFEEMDSVV